VPELTILFQVMRYFYADWCFLDKVQHWRGLRDKRAISEPDILLAWLWPALVQFGSFLYKETLIKLDILF
jgi:hypothetical protein